MVLKNEIGSVTVVNEGSGYVGGQQPIDVTTNPFQVATATAVLATTGTLKEFTLTNRGSNYTIQPNVTLTGGGGTGGGGGSAVLATFGILNSVDIQSGGTGYTGPTGCCR